MPQLRVHFHPDRVAADDLAGSRAVVIDVLRATTTTVTALAAGARAVVPCLTVEDARAAAAGFPIDQRLLGGERGGLPIAGFDLGNSPAEYLPAVVAGRTIVLTTTNGTRALLHCRAAADVVVAALVNLSAVCEQLHRGPVAQGVDVVCAGTGGQDSHDDVLAAGAIAARLAAASGWRLDDRAEQAREAWLCVAGSAAVGLEARVAAALGETAGGRNLLAIGMEDDIALAAAIDRYPLVPRFDPRTGRIEL